MGFVQYLLWKFTPWHTPTVGDILAKTHLKLHLHGEGNKKTKSPKRISPFLINLTIEMSLSRPPGRNRQGSKTRYGLYFFYDYIRK